MSSFYVLWTLPRNCFLELFHPMAVNSRNNKMLRLCNAAGAEFLGSTMFLFITISTVVNYGPTPTDGTAAAPIGVATVFGATIGALIFAFGNTSGAHLNPAVTIAFIVQRSTNVLTGIVYILAQCIGATCGALLARAVSNDELYQAGQGVNLVQPGHHEWQAFLAEIIATALLVTVVMQVTGLLPVNDVGRHVLGLIVPVAVGAAVLVAHLALIPIDGCSINPARSLGALIAASGKAPSKAWSQIWLSIVGPVIGGALPAIVKTYLVPTTYPPNEDVNIAAPLAISPAGFKVPTIEVSGV
jgi:aquaporin PIP